MVKVAKEGLPLIAIPVGVTVLTALMSLWWATAVSATVSAFLLYFFRDPDRTPPSDDSTIVCPADGKVITVRHHENKWLVSIFMSVFNVHVNRIPCDAVVESVKHTPGGFKVAYLDDASLYNENTEILLKTDFGRIVVKQIAGLLARRIICRLRPGDRVKKGERFGLIMFGSRVDVWIPDTLTVKVTEGQKVKAGETILARKE